MIGNPIDVKVVKDDMNGLTIITSDDAASGEEVMTEVYTLDGRLVAGYQPGEAVDVAPGVYVLSHRMSDGSVKVEKKAIR